MKGSGGVVCKVVLPDPKKSEKDIVVFLPDSRAAKTTEEAQQRAAVAALHRVQGVHPIPQPPRRPSPWHHHYYCRCTHPPAHAYTITCARSRLHPCMDGTFVSGCSVG